MTKEKIQNSLLKIYFSNLYINKFNNFMKISILYLQYPKLLLLLQIQVLVQLRLSLHILIKALY